ncbi:MAG: tetratricopeptide repeat protein [Deltaproteobacteria bacterium]|nr:tetratricopeptide repeat protein [Deltaproteobacteria bacterium]MBW1922757.1 tetratricopeptide repeat protein [Deltaproteobacteria bacterium]MBW2007877.1 tetratricopeptide repeat protein [Deltaproteobacteria bacterium]
MGVAFHRIVAVCLFLACLFAFFSPGAFAGRIILDADGQLGFARHLMSKGEYDAAVSEFERFIHFFPEDTQVPLAQELKGLCLLMGRHYEKAREVFRHILKTYPASESGAKALFLIGESYYRQGVPKEAEIYFRKLIRDYPRSDLRYAALYRLGWTGMRQDRWEEASEYFRRAGSGGSDFLNARILAEKSLQGRNLPQKSPALAGGLAAVVPGLGHAYTGRYRDAAVAFLVNGLFIWAAVESFEQDHEVLGGMLLFLEAGWYSGNIYSAVGAAHKHNRRVRDAYRRGLGDRLHLGLLAGGKDSIGLGLTYEFR